MANISREERLRREAEAAAASTQNTDAPDESSQPAPDEPADPNTDVDIEPPVVIPPPPEPPKPTPPPVQVKPDKGLYDVDELDVKHFKANKLAEEKQKSLDAIEQAIRDACKITEDKIRKDEVVVELTNDPGDVEKRLAFLRKYGPSNVKPPKPEPTPMGIKDIKLMEWTAKYEPDVFLKTYGHSNSPVAKRLRESIRKSA